MGNRLSRCRLEWRVVAWRFLRILLNTSVESPSAALYATPKYDIPVSAAWERHSV